MRWVLSVIASYAAQSRVCSRLLRRLWLLAMTCSFFFFPFVLQAVSYDGLGPFSHRIQNPLYLQMVSFMPERALVLPAKTFQAELTQAYSNIFERVLRADFDYISDVELLRVGMIGRYGLGKNFEVGMEVPWLHFNGGFLDSFIQNFHHAFGFPNGGRTTVPNNQFAFHVVQNGKSLYTFNKQDWNLGDIHLFAKHLILEEGDVRPAIASRFILKLPTGSPSEGTGSGNPGFGLGVALEKTIHRFHFYLNMNYLVEGGNDSIQAIENFATFEWMAAGEFSFSKHVSALFELVGSTPRLKGSHYDPWDGVPLDMMIGLRGNYPPWSWQIGFSEDASSRGPSIDFTAWTTLAYRFN